MLLPLHILTAIASLGLSTYAFFYPSKPKLRFSYGLIAATLASGFYLVWSSPSHMASACITGLAYVGIVAAATVATRHKLARAGHTG